MLQLVLCNIIISGVQSSGMSRCLIFEVHFWMILSIAKISVAPVFGDWVWKTAGIMLTGENHCIRRETCSRASLSPLNPHRLNCDQNQAFPVKDECINAWFIAPHRQGLLSQNIQLLATNLWELQKSRNGLTCDCGRSIRPPTLKNFWRKFISCEMCETPASKWNYVSSYTKPLAMCL